MLTHTLSTHVASMSVSNVRSSVYFIDWY